MSLTKEQWECLAAFAGVGLLGEFGKDMRGDLYPIRLVGSFTNGWHPNSDWRDFGPLWMKLEQWIYGPWRCWSDSKSVCELHNSMQNFRDQFRPTVRGTEQALMQAGCELGAAIGKAMREGK